MHGQSRRELERATFRGRLEGYLPLPYPQGRQRCRARLRNAELIYPLYHGEHCTGLFGLYAIVNAIRLALATKRPLTDREASDIIAAGLRFMELRGSLSRSILYGVRQSTWRRMVAALLEYTTRRTGVLLFMDQPFRSGAWLTRVELFSVLETLVIRQQATIILRRGAHYTIVSGFTPASFILFDSAGYRWIRRVGCGINGEEPRPRHPLCPSSITTIVT